MNQAVVLNNRYRLLARLGTGGMANVYKAQDLLLTRIVAVKVLHDNLIGDPAFLRRFEREARAAANLSHPNIVTVHDVGQDGTIHYIVMEYIDAEDLKALIVREAPLSVERAVDLALQICAGVGSAHRAGLVHCDVKPQNVLLTADGRVKVTDFGIARALTGAVTQTPTDIVWGSPHYFAPEQAAGDTPTPASDVYSIGVILYEMLTGRVPFDADNPTALALMHLREAPLPPSQFNPLVPDALEEIVLKLLAKEPAARYRNAEQAGRILESYRNQSAQWTQSGPAVSGPAVSGPAVSGPAVSGPAVDLSRPALPVPARRPPQTNVALPMIDVEEPADDTLAPGGDADTVVPAGVDWVAVILALVALLAVFGLIPLWAAVYYSYTRIPPPPPPLPTPIPALGLLLMVAKRHVQW